MFTGVRCCGSVSLLRGPLIFDAINFLMLLILECILERLPFLQIVFQIVFHTWPQLHSWVHWVVFLRKRIHYDSPSLTQRWKWVCPSCCKNAWFQLENNYSYPTQEEKLEIPKRREGCQKPQIIKESKNQAEGQVQKTLPGRGTWGYFLEQHNNKMLWMT